METTPHKEEMFRLNAKSLTEATKPTLMDFTRSRIEIQVVPPHDSAGGLLSTTGIT